MSSWRRSAFILNATRTERGLPPPAIAKSRRGGIPTAIGWRKLSKLCVRGENCRTRRRSASRGRARSNRMAERFESAAPHPRDGEWYALIAGPRPESATLDKALKLFGATAIALIALNLYAPGAPTLLERVFASATLA